MKKTIKKQPALILSIITICLIVIAVCGLGIYWVMPTNHYPAATRITSIGKCGSAETYHHGRTFRVSTQQCLTTTDRWGEVAVWYQSHGYRWQNDGQVQLDSYSFVIDIFRTERIYILELEEGQRDIRVYTDYTIRLP